jgi:hypothetical protein
LGEKILKTKIVGKRHLTKKTKILFMYFYFAKFALHLDVFG